jgi:signal transduction histidine kinase
VTPTEERIPVTIAAAPIGNDPARFGAVAVVSDVRRERDIAAMREMLVSMVSHELRTPITTVLGFSELILEGELEADQIKEAAAEIVDAAARLETLVNDLLSSAALQRGALSLNKRPVSLEAIVKQALASFPPEERERIRICCDDHLIEADPDRLVQVLCNILANALKYSPRSSPVELHAYREHGMAKISVRDFGIGIDEETMGKLFTMFGRSADERVRSSPGTGLGLYIAKRLVELHGGNIEVISAPEKGSRFTVVLPL